MKGPRRIWVGLGLIALAWPLNWGLSGLRTHLLFFPLWLGYVLVVDGINVRRSGTSILTRSKLGFLRLFLLSIPGWWLFELFNLRLHNWEYVGRENLGRLEYFLLCSLSFSTVMPAVLGTAELMRGYRWIERFARGPCIPRTKGVCLGLFLTGLAMLTALLAWPTRCYPLLWCSLVLLLEPLCVLLGRRSLLSDLQHGDWRPWISLWAGALICGFSWELWNLYSYPKWIYHVPGVDFLHVFEMPLLGYLGYLPFGLELYLIHQLCSPEGKTTVA